MADAQAQADEAPLDIPWTRRLWIACQWGLFWCGVGLVADASPQDALLYGAGAGFVLGWFLRVGILRFLWWRLTCRHLHFWKTFDWRRFV